MKLIKLSKLTIGLTLLTSLVLVRSNSGHAADGVIDININPAASYTITASGSYRVVADVTMTGAISAITVNANKVTIDLGGHSLRGSGSLGSVHGINASNDTDVVIMNGVIE